MITKEDWKTQPFPNDIEKLGYQNSFLGSDAEKLIAGHMPQVMEDKWFVYSEDGWVYFVRSWTGFHIFAIQLAETSGGNVNVTASWVSTDLNQYQSRGKENDIKSLNAIINALFDI
jgi:hypothetical protein|tara:strand:- start:121 stop:468 length:348 start_codon:yes stop_codon:yes gene_type:complete